MEALKQIIILMIPWLIMFNFREALDDLNDGIRMLILHIPGVWGIAYFVYYNHVTCKHTIEMYTNYDQATVGMAAFTRILHNPYLLAVIYFLFLAFKVNICGLIIYYIRLFNSYADLMIGAIIYALVYYKIGMWAYKSLTFDGKWELGINIACLCIVLIDALWVIMLIIGLFIDLTDLPYLLSDLRDKIPVKRKGLSLRQLEQEWKAVFIDMENLKFRAKKTGDKLQKITHYDVFDIGIITKQEENLDHVKRSIEYLIYQRDNFAKPFHNYSLDAAKEEAKSLYSDMDQIEKEVNRVYAKSLQLEQEEKAEFQKKEEEKRRKKAQEQKKKAENKRKEEENRRKKQEQNRKHIEKSKSSQDMFFTGCKDLKALNARYKKLVKIYHPDSETGSEEVFKRLQEEYDYHKKHLKC